MIWIFYILLFLAGTIFGSFLNSCILRSAQWVPIWKGRSCCVICNKSLGAKDLVPVISFILLKGNCRYCKTNISIQYPIVEIFCGFLFVWLAKYYNLSIFEISTQYIRDIIILLLLVFIFIYDLKYMQILNRVTTIPAVILFFFSWKFGWLDWQGMLIAVFVACGFFLFQYIISKGSWIGGGDIRMGLFMGVILGWPNIILGLFLSYIIGAILSIILILLRKRNRRSQIPFGIYLSIGTYIALFWGEKIINWYLRMI